MFSWVLKVWVAATAFRQLLHTSKHTLSLPGREEAADALTIFHEELWKHSLKKTCTVKPDYYELL